jgi:hypothetical protein
MPGKLVYFEIQFAWIFASFGRNGIPEKLLIAHSSGMKMRSVEHIRGSSSGGIERRSTFPGAVVVQVHHTRRIYAKGG